MQSELSLPDNWSWAPLAALTGVNPVTYGVVQPGADVASGVPMVRVNNFSSHRLELGSVMRISAEIESKYRRTRLRPNDVLITIVGSVGQVAVVPPELLGWNIARAVALIRPEDPGLSRWLSFCLRSPFSQRQLGLSANTTVQTTINLKDLRQLPIPMPPSSERDSITGILSALEDRIDCLNDEMMSFESIASAIFKSWFIDFDPVRAKAEGREPEGMSADIAALFPDGFVEAANRLVPKGWDIRKLGDLLSVLETGRRPKGGVGGIESGVPSIGAESISKVGEFDYGKVKYVSAEFYENMRSGKLSSHDVLLYKDGGKPGVFLPRVSLFGNGFPFEECGINEHVFRLRVIPPLTQEFLYFWMWSDAIMHELKHRGGKAAIPGINQSDVRELDVLVPSEVVMNAFSNVVSPLINRILENSKSIRVLGELRDSLLPKLLSGRLSVSSSCEIGGRISE